MKSLIIAAVALVLLSCQREVELLDSRGPTIYIEVENLSPLNPGEGHYEAWISFANPSVAKTTNSQDADSSFVSIGKFNVDTNGSPVGMDGTFLIPHLAKERNPIYAIDAIITIELEEDTDDIPGSAILGGAFTGNARVGVANLTTNYQDALGAGFRNAEGYFLFDAPTSADSLDWRYGIWFMKATSPASAGLIDLPRLPEGWKYEGWIRYAAANPPIHSVRRELSTGKFILPDSADEDGAGPAKGPNCNGYNFPGQDFILREAGFEILSVAVRIEPHPDNSPDPFLQLTLFGSTSIPDLIQRGQPVRMQNNSTGFPTARITVVR